jgi:WD40 repeat protein/DNA-binding SARP family transcriptional activator/energy-coupling factor transporter ATP-binding protein EcfA2
MAANRLEFRILGPLAVLVDGVPVPAGGPKQRALLAMLLLNANRVVSRERLVGELFPAQDVDSADHALRNQVSRLRKVLSPVATDAPRLVARPPGYLLRVEPGELDLDTFERLVADARTAADPASAARSLRAAEALWSGRPLADLELEVFARAEVERLEERRLAAVETRIEAELALGGQLALVSELETLSTEHPFRERFRAQLMLALYRSGRQAEGLEVYRQTRQLMNDELGLEPGAELQQLERAILVQDVALEIDGNGARDGHAPPPDVCPFKGLAQFEQADAEFFFGRERLVDELVSRLAETPLLAIVGPSGSGKSSLLRAGLLAALPYESVLIRPGEKALAQLRAALRRVGPGERLVVAVDQFEELFGATVGDDTRRSFLDSLVEAAWDPDRRVLVVIALRADFFGHLAAYVDVADLVGPNHVLLGPMTATELRRAIEGPAERAGLVVEPALVDTLVDEIGGEAGGLPLLSTSLLDLWRERRGNTLTVAAYERSGGVRGAVGRHAEATFRSLDRAEQQIARRILLRLVAGGDGDPFTRRRATRAELDADEDDRVAAVLAALVERRLLVADDGTVELVHEALVERWQRLADWLQGDVQGRLLHRQLALAATEWHASGCDPSALYRGARLAGALEWADEHGPDLNQLEGEFLDESRDAAAREADRQRRANRRLRGLVIVVASLLALAVVAAAFALQKRSQARREATGAVAQRLGAQALIDPDLDRSLLLAREGVNLVSSETTRSNLLAVLLRAPEAIGVVREGSSRLLDEALSRDGRTLAVRGDHGDVAFFDTRTLRRSRPSYPGTDQIGLFGFGFLNGPLHGLAFSPDGRTLAVGSTTGAGIDQAATIDLVRRHTQVSKAEWSPISGAVTADVAYAPDGRTLATGAFGGSHSSQMGELILVNDAQTGRELARVGPIPGGRLAGYTANGRSLLVTHGKRSSLLYDARTLTLVRTFPVGGAAAVSPASGRAAFGHEDGTVTFLDLRTGRMTTLGGRAGAAINALAFSRDGRTLASANDDGTVSLWDTRAATLSETLTGHTGPVAAASFSPDGRTLYTAAYDGSVIAWDIAGARGLVRPFRFSPLRSDGSTGSAVSPDGSLLAVSPAPDRVVLRSAHTRRPVGSPLEGPVGHVTAIAFSPDGKLLAAAGYRNAALWDVATRKLLRVVSVGSYGATSVAFSPDGLTLAIGRNDSVDGLYDVRTGRQTARLDGDYYTTDLAFSRDGKLLAVASAGGTVTIWDVAAQSILSALNGAVSGTVAVDGVSFAPGGRLLAIANSSGRVVFWKLDPRHRFEGAWAARPTGQALDAPGVESVDFDTSGKRLVTLGSDGKLRLFDVETRKLIGAPLIGAGNGADGTAHFFRDGKHVLGVFSTGRAVLWDVDPAAWAAQACLTAHRNLTRAEWRDSLGARPYRSVCP